MVSNNQFINLTSSQHGMLYHCLNENCQSLYISQAEIFLNESILIENLWKAWDLFFDRHEILRTKLVQNEKGHYFFKLNHGLLPEKIFIDLSHQKSAAQKRTITKFKKEDLKKGIDLMTSPLMRLTLFKLASDSYALICTYHHIILCAPSAIQGLHEVFKTYQSICNKEKIALPAPIPYSKTVKFINLHSNQILKEYWSNLLQDYTVTTDLPFNPSNQSTQLKSDAYLFKVGASLYRKIRCFCKEFGLTPSIIFQFVWGITLAKYINKDDFVIGVVRAYPSNQMKNSLGLFINTLPLRIKYDRNTSALECLKSIKEQVRYFKSQSYISLSELLRMLKLDPDKPLFSTAIDVKPYNYIEQLLSLDQAWSKRDLSFHTDTHYPLMLEVWAGQEEFNCRINYDASLFKRAQLRQFGQHFLNVLSQVLNAPNKKVAELQLMTLREIKCLSSWNDTDVAYQNFEPIPYLFSEQAKTTPHNMALIFGSSILSYQELDTLTDQLASYLLNQLGPLDKYVAICLDRSPDVAIAIYAIWKAGLAYIPLDPSFPQKRKDLIIFEANPSIILTQDIYMQSFSQGKVLNLAKIIASISGQERRPFKILAKMDDAAYVLFTSGTTGMPKGVVISHRSLSNRILWMQEKYLLAHEDKVLQKTPYTFDVSLWEFCWPLITGASLVVAKPEGHKDPDYLISEIEQHQISVLHFVPSMLRLFLSQISQQSCKSLRYVFSSGEALQSSLVRDFYSKSNSRLINLYGPTEATVDVTYYECGLRDLENSIPIGKPIYNTELFVLDSYLNQMPVGAQGELYIAGLGLALGYLNNTELTQEKFINIPLRKYKKAYKSGDLAFLSEEGLFYYVSRIDSQVKLNGYRIELQEIESYLYATDLIKEVAVLVVNNQIVAFFTRKNIQAEMVESKLRESLKAALPFYMVPHQFIELKALPLSSSGKIDYKALLAQAGLCNKNISYREEALQGAKERILIDLWSRVLDVKVGLDDDFYSLGGDSIRSIEIVGLARKKGIGFSVEQLLRARTIRSLAELINSQGVAVKENLLEFSPFALLQSNERQLFSNNSNVEDAYPLSELQQGMVFNKILNPELPIYQDTFHYQIRGVFNKRHFYEALLQTVNHYEVLRTAFNLVDFDTPLQIVFKNVKIPFSCVTLRTTQEYSVVIKKIVNQEQAKAIDLIVPPLFRIKILLINESRFDIFFTLHHAILDGWSIGILINNLLHCYSRALKNQDLVFSQVPKYRQYIVQECLVISDHGHIEFWKNYTDQVEKFSLKTNVQPEGNLKINFLKINFPKQILSKLKRLNRQEGVSLKAILLAAHLRLLMMLSGKKQVLSGVVTHARQSIPHSAEMVGLFLNTIPISVTLEKEAWINLIKRVQSTLEKVQPYQAYPWREILKFIDSDTLQATDVLFNFTDLYSYGENEGATDISIIGGEAYEFNEFSMVCHYNLSKIDGALELRLSYKNDKLNKSFADRIGCYVNNILQSIVHDPQEEYLKFDYLSVADRHQIEKFNLTAKVIPDQSILDLFTKVACQNNNIAVVDQENRLTFHELEQFSNKVANFLLKKGVRPGQVVGVCFSRSIELVVVLLGLLKCGAMYLPLLPSLPLERIKSCLLNARASHVVTNVNIHMGDKGFIDNIIFDAATIKLESDIFLKTNICLDQDMYVIYTSGTTKEPRGVAIKHRSVMNVLNFFSQEIKFSKRDSLLAVSEISFDISVLEIFMPLINGAKLVIAPSNPLQHLIKVKKLIQKESITTLQCTPTFLASAANTIKRSNINKILCGGETFPMSLLHTVKYKERRIWNVYGPTETTIWSTIFTLPKQASKMLSQVPIGIPITNTQIYLLDEALNILPNGVSGNILIVGDGVAQGYLGNRSSASFIEFNGNKGFLTNDVGYISDCQLNFQGRSDRTTKLSGILVNLETAEAILYKKFSFKRIVVIALHDLNILAICLNQEDKVSETAVRDELAKSYPFYLLAIKVFYLDVFPLNNSGKIDTKSLIKIIHSKDSYNHASTISYLNDELAHIWCKTLGGSSEVLDNNKNFFGHGASSLDSLRLINQVSKAFNVEIKLSDFIQNPTLTSLRKLVAISSNKNKHFIAKAFPKKVPFTYTQERIWYASYIHPSDYKLFYTLQLDGLLNYEKVESALNHIVSRHPFLTCYVDKKNLQLSLCFPAPAPQVTVNICSSSFLNLDADISSLVNASMDLRHNLPLEVVLLKISEIKHILVFIIHHLVIDHESMKVLLNLFHKFYNQKLLSIDGKEQDLKASYIRYIQEDIDYENNYKMSLFWESYFRSKSYVTHFLNHSMPSSSEENRPLEQTISIAQQSLLVNLAKQYDVSIFHLLLASWASFLMLYTGQENIMVASPVSLREWNWQEGLIANFTNVLYLVFSLRDSKNLGEMLKKFGDDWQQIYPNRFYPVAKALKNFTEPQIMFVFNENASDTISLEGLKAQQFAYSRNDAKYEVTLFVEKKVDQTVFLLHYNRQFFSKTSMQTLLEAFNKYLSELLESSDQSWNISNFPAYKNSQEHHILAKQLPKNEISHINVLGDNLKFIKIVKEAWQQLFAINEIDVDRSIFDLGPTSLMVIKAYGLLKEKLPQTDVKVDDLYKYSTIRKLAHYLNACSSGAVYQQNTIFMEQVPSSGKDLDIILLPPLSGLGACYTGLIEKLNLHNINSTAFDLVYSTKSLKNITELANIMCADITSNYKGSRNLILCGYSLGGILALLMANELINRGFKIRGIILIDSWAEASEQQKSNQYLEQKFREMIRDYDINSPLVNLDELHSRMRLVNSYKPEMFNLNIPVFLLKASEINPELKDIDSKENHWDSYLSIKKLYLIKANHDNLLQEPSVSEVLMSILDIHTALNKEL